MHKVRILFFICICLLTSGFSFADERVITLGGKDGWPEMSKMERVTRGTGRFGYECLELATDSRVKDAYTDLLISFEGNGITDESGNYSVRENLLKSSSTSVMGKKSALALGDGGLRLRGALGTLFGSTGATGSFLIEFWLCPSIAENGEVVFSWRSSRTEDDYLLYQMITASFFNNHLQWRFSNVFTHYASNGGEVSLSSYSTIIPNIWTHHSISYDSSTGMLEYRINGALEDLKYVTTNGREQGGSVYPAQLGVVADIEICPEYTGYVDDFRIQRTNVSDLTTKLRYDTYSSLAGRVESQPIMVSKGAKLKHVESVTSVPSQTSVMIYVRSGDNYFNWTDSYPRWTAVPADGNIDGVQGLYFQVAMDLYTDGKGSVSPSVTQLDLLFDEAPSPLPPFTVYATAGDGEVTVSWSPSVDNTAGGYYIYYGERPGEYLGYVAAQGTSPIDVGNVSTVTLTNLENGKIYYFAIASYSSIDEAIVGVLSKEVYARPIAK